MLVLRNVSTLSAAIAAAFARAAPAALSAALSASIATSIATARTPMGYCRQCRKLRPSLQRCHGAVVH